ncbi:MAG: 2-phospho-L-lactate guanylyltransferase [Candidatus Binatus sp.]|uniref:2-phospho-L-lactate guanylyltransferase n=1 Tax=Candidatus Binatus sp. TaxID=2811406 RepID=UPI002726B167|nr:2-phospho-L-lactate guanylyltransferase [Candidatus Binatus sp.]MDO8434552.1 2-phospho-L-lactate guanylyltransferase [Candidatus Binatus sp.]
MRSILIAAKQLELAKTRLASVLPPGERIALADAMFRDVLAAATRSRIADQVAVVSSDRRLLGYARDAGALPIDEEFPRGLNAAVALASAVLKVRGANTVCTVLSDIPLTTADDIDQVFAAMPSGCGAVLVPSGDFSGTNVICRSPADVVATHFGRMSLLRHLDDCRTSDLPAKVLRLARPALDLDVITDLIEFVRAGSSTYTHNHLARLGIADH